MCQKKRYFSMGIVFLGVILMFAGWVEQAQAQKQYPSEPIEIIVSYNTGGTTDMTARIMADYMTKKWGIPINVVNKPAGNRLQACLELYRAKPDGYTLLQDGSGSSVQMPLVLKDLPFKVMDRTFIAGFVEGGSSVYIVANDSPIKSLKDLEAEIKKDPGNFTWTSLGGAGSYDLAMRRFLKAIGVDVRKTKPLVIKGGIEGVTFTAAGTVKMGYCTFSSGGPSINSKVVRPLAVTTNKRDPAFPDVPTVGEEGYPTAIQGDIFGPSGPPNLPSHIVEIWNKALEGMIKDPEVVKKFERLGCSPNFLNSSEIRKRRLAESEEIKELYGL